MERLLAFFAALLMITGLPANKSLALSPNLPPNVPFCGSPIPSGELVEPAIIDISALPRDSLGRRELILSAVHSGERFCYRYLWKGAERYGVPTLRVHRGERFVLRLVNELSNPAPAAAMSAARLAKCQPASMPQVKPQIFSGYLHHALYARDMTMEPTDVNIHLHGFQGPAEQENVFLSTLSTPARACEYELTIPRTQPPGTYIYHPHAHGMTSDEVAGGLAGMWIVQPDKPQIPQSDEHEIILRYQMPLVNDSDISPAQLKEINRVNAARAAGAVARERSLKLVPPILTYNPFDPPPWPSQSSIHAGGATIDPNGCPGMVQGSPLLSVDGINAPAHLTVQAGRPQLLRVLNATAEGFKYLRLHDASGKIQTLHVVGRDGIPVSGDDLHPLARYIPMEGVVLGPSDRADILLAVPAGQTLTLYSERGCTPLSRDMFAHDLLKISGQASPDSKGQPTVASTPVTEKDSRAVQLLRYAQSHRASIRRRALTYTVYALPDANGDGRHPEFYITETSNRNFHEKPFWPDYRANQNTPEQADIVVKAGSIEEWYLFNTALGPHTFHIHQMSFAAEDERPMPVMIDNVLLPAARALPNPNDPDHPLIKPSRTRILLDFRHVPRGEFVFHCHMLFHEDHGMMGVVRVI